MSNKANNPSASERLDRVQFGYLCAIERAQTIAAAARAPKLHLASVAIAKATQSTIEAIEELKENK